LKGFKVRLDGAWSNLVSWKPSLLMDEDLVEMSLPTSNHSWSLQLEGFKVRLDGAGSNWNHWKI